MIEVPTSFTRGLIGQWRDYAFEAHGDQLYGPGPSLQREHLDEGARFLHSLGYQRVIVGGYYLHDVDEDTDTKIETMQTDLQLPLFVVRGLRAITSPKGEAREAQTQRAAEDPVSAVWKFGDSVGNLAAKINHPSLLEPKQFRLSQEYVHSAYTVMQVMLTPRAMRAYVAQQRELEGASQ